MRQITNKMTIFALTNGMIGGVILLLPVLALSTGSLLIPIITFVCGITSFYTAWLSVRHLKNSQSMDQAVRQHFDDKPIYPSIYNAVMAISMTSLLIIYYDLLNSQIIGLVRLYQKTNSQAHLLQDFLSYIIVFFLFILIIPIRKYSLGAHLMGYGIISIVIYCIFLIWVLASAPAYHQYSTQDGNQQITVSVMPLADKQFIRLAAHLGLGYAIHNFMVPILKRNKNIKTYSKILSIVYVIGFFIYTFISYSAYGILNRKPPHNRPTNIQDYFKDSQGNSNWEVFFLQILYAFHIVSVFPQFLIIAKSRYFAIFQRNKVIHSNAQNNDKSNQEKQIKDTPNNLQKNNDQINEQNVDDADSNRNNIDDFNKMRTVSSLNNQLSQKVVITQKQYTFYIVFLTGSLILRLGGVKVIQIAQFNGAFICFLYVYMIPIIIHLKCVYFTGHVKNQRYKAYIQKENKNKDNMFVIEENKQDSKDEKNEKENQIITVKLNYKAKSQDSCNNIQQCHGYCSIRYSSKWLKRLQLLVVIIVISVGLFTMIYTLGRMLKYLDTI